MLATLNPLVAGRVDQPSDRWAGIWLAEDIELIAQGVRSGSWIDTSLGGVSAAVDGLMLYSDPASTLLQYGLSACIEHIQPLTDALEWLSGDAAQIAAHAQTWRNVAARIRADADGLARHQATGWHGAAADAYRDWTGEQRVTITALAEGCDTMAVITDGAAALIAGVRYMVRDAISSIVSRAVVWATEGFLSAGVLIPVIVEQCGIACASWGARIATWLRALVESLHRLSPIIRRLSAIIEQLKRILTRLRGPARLPDGLDRVHGKGSGPSYRMNMTSVRSVAAKYGIDLSSMHIVIQEGPRGCFGVTRPDGSVVLYRDAFSTEEDLARTLVHEQVHAQDLASGLPYPRDRETAESWEDRAYAYEDLWWNGQPVRPEGGN
jgi:hypothetical protein